MAWTDEEWSRVLFSDEKIFWVSGHHGRVYVRRPVGAAMVERYTVQQMAHPCKINGWGCISAAGQGHLALFNNTLDKHLYCQILGDLLIPSARSVWSFDPPTPWFFQQDNSPIHKATIVTELLHRKGVSLLEHPPYSPDLNPIENVWADMQRELDRMHITTQEALIPAIQTIWGGLDRDVIRRTVLSMHDRCAKVVELKGWHIDV